MTTTATETKSLVLLRHHLKALRLPTIGAECEKVARRCAADNADHLNYLLEYNTRFMSGNEAGGYSFQYPR